MIGKAKTEAEQVAFFESVHARFRQGVANVSEVHRDYEIAGLTIRLSFAGPRLVASFTRALEHLEVGAVESPDATFCLWDSISTGVSMLPPPCDREAFSDRGDLWGFHSRRIKTAFHYHDYSVNLFDRDRRTGIYWVQNGDVLPYWTLASPLRTLFYWCLEQHGRQLVHAAAVGTEEGAVLVVGKGGLGKSSTALTCLEAGLDFIGDDYLVVANEPEPVAYSLYATAKVNPEDLARFPGLRSLVSQPVVPPGEKALLFLNSRFRPQIRRKMPIQAVAVPRVVDGEDSAFHPEAVPTVQQAATFTTMAQLPYAGDRTHEFFATLCDRLPAYRLELGRDKEKLAGTISGFLANGASHPSERIAALDPLSETPLVSVVIPVLNGERFVGDAVASILAQEYPALEIIIVDDGSTDGTEAAVRRLPCDVHFFKQGNFGPAAARNRGVRDAAGDFVAFLDVDDLWPANTLRTLVEELMHDPSLEVAHGYAQVMELDPASGNYEYRGNPKESFPHSIALGVYRKRVFDRVGLFDKTLTFGEDTDWFNRANENGVAMKRVDRVTLLVRRHDRNMTHEKTLVELNMLRVFKKAIDRKRTADGLA